MTYPIIPTVFSKPDVKMPTGIQNSQLHPSANMKYAQGLDTIDFFVMDFSAIVPLTEIFRSIEWNQNF
jgi:hypothetical protein